jgi:serine/threonine protein kinase
MIATGSRLKDRYRLERLLGRGGMASVWLATDEVLERPVAIKVLSDTISSDPEFLARFRREAHLAAGLSHPNLIGVYDYAEGEERPYLVMEYVPGPNLAERTSRQMGIDCEQLARELLGALAHIHAVGIVHRDVKPQNVLIAPEGNAKLIDFGIALPKDATALTGTGNLLGTARYIAPEVMGGRPASERSDLYSCGVVLRDCLGGRPPRRLGAVVERLANQDPGRRPASADEALARLGARSAPIAEPTERMKTTNAERQSQASGPSGPRWSIAAASVIALAGLTGILLLLSGGAEEQLGGGPASEVVVEPRRSERASDSSPSEGRGEAPTRAAVPTPGGADSAEGGALNEQGFELIQAGEYETAVSVLDRAVRAFPPGTEDLDYAYALFNLGNALRLSGHPDEAIPVLERRLEIPNQTSVVRQELEAARGEAQS